MANPAFKKYFLVSAEQFEQLKKLAEPVVTSSNLSNEIGKILADSKLSEHEKLNLYRQVLPKHLQEQKLLREPVKLSMVEPVSDITLKVPIRHNAKARKVAAILLNSRRLTWDDDGQIIIFGKLIPETSILDLIQDLYNPISAPRPIGSLAFKELVKLAEIPSAWIENRFYKPDAGNVLFEAQSTSRSITPSRNYVDTPMQLRSAKRKRLADLPLFEPY